MPDTSSASGSLHGPLIEQTLPAWAINATPQRRADLKQAGASVPDWYRQATPTQRQALNAATLASFTAQSNLDHVVANLQGIDSFAEPLLVKALQDQFGIKLDVHKTLLHLKKTVAMGIQQTELGSFEVLRLPLLQAALHNFEASESADGAFHRSSGFLNETATGEQVALSTTMGVAQFIGLCRSLDIGAKYQVYLNDYLYPADSAQPGESARLFGAAQKNALSAAAHLALLKKDIRPADFDMIQSVVNGAVHPQLDGKPVWFRDLQLMKHRLTGCVLFVICEQYRYSDDLILYIPGDPYAPLKRYTRAQLQTRFKQLFTERNATLPNDGSPTDYQRFFSRFVAYADRPDYFSQFVEDAPGSAGSKLAGPFVSLVRDVLDGYNPFSLFTAIDELPPQPVAAKVAKAEPFLAPGALARKGHGIWAANIDLWDYLYDRHREQLIADARSHAVPTADVDARVRSEKFAKLLNIGMLLFNGVAMLVPGLGEVMMVVMAGQLLYETFEGTMEWAEGDRRAAKAHLLDVAENLAMLAVMAGAGKGLGKLMAARPEPVIEALEPVTSADGKNRLWKPQLEAYASPLELPHDAKPSAMGQYHVEGKTYIRLDGSMYQVAFDESLKRWRISHPHDTTAYAPLLDHNNAGAWRHVLERPQSWDRTTLIRRLGPITDGLSDEQLRQVADISGTGDAALRKVHLDNAPLPPALADTLRLFKADADVAQVLEQLSGSRAVDDRYLYSVPLLTDLPRWPVGRVLEVFDGPGLTGGSKRYGAERLYHGTPLKPPIQVSRTDVLAGWLPMRVVAALDETEVVQLLGGEAARVTENRPSELGKQLAAHARARQSALFESLYKGTDARDPTVAKLQRLYPGVSEPAARSVMADAGPEQLARLRDTGRVPLAMHENLQWQVSQSRLSHAYAGLQMENLQALESKRLALQTLGKLPGWSDQVRLEIREGSIEGPLLDGVGSPTATQRKYVVKQGPRYQAFDERGEALNSIGQQGDNFYSSLMHALPDEARQSLGLPHVGQSLELRRAIVDYAAAHPPESAQVVEQHSRPRAWFKPPQRISPKLIGYPASGGGQGLSQSLVSRVRDVYPQLTEDQANGFILRQMLADRSDQQIFNLLNNRLREWQTLQATLDTWVRTEPTDPFIRQYPQMDSRPAMAQALLASWRNAPLAEMPGAAILTLMGDTPLPALSADFSHVRTLNLRGRSMLEGHVEQLLSSFMQVRELSLAALESSEASVPRALENMPQLTHLSIESDAALSGEALARLEGLSGLEHLLLSVAQAPARVLDVARLAKLRSLKLAGRGMREFPQGALSLPDLERLDFKGSDIDRLAPQLFEPGYERFWRGLSMKWSRFSHERFKAAYDFVNGRPGHLMDLDEMVQEYCEEQLNEGLGRTLYSNTGLSSRLSIRFFDHWRTTPLRFAAIEAIIAEYAELTARLDHWIALGEPKLESYRRVGIAGSLRNSWYQGLLQRYGISQPSSLSLAGLMVGELPELPPEGFGHVVSLYLPNSRVPSVRMGRFIRGFSGLKYLDVRDCGLTHLPVAPGDWPVLEHLNLSNNPLESLEVGSLSQLRSLDLSATHLQAWPVGVEQLPHLVSLDLRNTRMTHLPDSALAQDHLLLDTQFTGTPLSVESQAQLATARQRVEHTLGLAEGALQRFEQQAAGQEFSPDECGSFIARRLLPLLLPDETAGLWRERLRSENLTPLQLGERIQGWEQAHVALVRRLNSWIFTRRINFFQQRVASSSAREIAARRLLECWREGLGSGPQEGGAELSFHGLILGEMPELATGFSHVEHLNLSGVELTAAGSNGFLQAFPRLRRLILNGNSLGGMPAALQRMPGLERLELSAIDLGDFEPWYPTLQSLPRLRWLDLSHGDLRSIRVEGLQHLETLDLSSNELTRWPRGVLGLPNLRTLNLSSNMIESIPPRALEGAHDALMAGTDLSDNPGLSLDYLYRLQAFSTRTGNDQPLGFGHGDVQQMINDIEYPPADSDTESNASGEEPALLDEQLDERAATDAERNPWFENLTPEEQASRGRLWDQLEAEPGHAAFFNLLSLLPHTSDFAIARASLTRRVWQVMEAAGANTELRETLFAMSSSHGTCTDGRILTFSGLEIKVHAFKVLEGIDRTDLAQKGAALLHLSRQLFRLEQVEALAASKMTGHSDPAEVRLQYLIGLKQRLDLPGVPENMRFATPIRGTAMESAAQGILDRENADGFYENLISRDYWVEYLEEKYPEEFAALERSRHEQADRLESRYVQLDDAYARAATTLDHELKLQRNVKLIELSHRETGASARR